MKKKNHNEEKSQTIRRMKETTTRKKKDNTKEEEALRRNHTDTHYSRIYINGMKGILAFSPRVLGVPWANLAHQMGGGSGQTSQNEKVFVILKVYKFDSLNPHVRWIWAGLAH